MQEYKIDNNYNVRAWDDQGDCYLLFANRLHNEKLVNWKGWHCHAGVDMIVIDFNLNVYSGECKNDLLGNLDSDFRLIENYTICRMPTCNNCTSDLKVEKSSNYWP